MSKAIIKETLCLLNRNGLSPMNFNWLAKINTVISVLASAIICIENLLCIVYSWKGVGSLETITSFLAYIQTMSKCISLVLYRDTLKQIIEDIDQRFWPYNKCGDDFENKLQTRFRLTRYLIYSIAFTTLMAVFSFVFTPLLSEPRSLPIDWYHPRDLYQSPRYEIVYVVQTFTMTVCPVILVSFDWLFISLITHLIKEFEMISTQIRTLAINQDDEEEEVLKQLQHIGNQHSLVLRCFKDMKKAFSLQLMTQIFATMILMCTVLVVSIADGFPPNLKSVGRGLSCLVLYLPLLFMYCLAGAHLTLQSEQVAIAVYESKWWLKTQPKVRRSLALITLRAQKMEILTAGGMIPLNLTTFTTIMKNAMSFFMMINALFNQTEEV